MYYIEIAIWLSMVLLLVGIFLIAIFKQFPTVFTTWISGKVDELTMAWEKRLASAESNTQRSWKLYWVWTLKYINFKKALLTTCYGALGLLLILNLSNITDPASTQVDVWVTQSLSPGMVKIQDSLQNGIDQVISNVENELNAELKVVV